MRNPPKAAQMAWKEGLPSIGIDEYAGILKIDRKERGERPQVEPRSQVISSGRLCWQGSGNKVKSHPIHSTMDHHYGTKS